jgi:hypothetical protein
MCGQVHANAESVRNQVYPESGSDSPPPGTTGD